MTTTWTAFAWPFLLLLLAQDAPRVGYDDTPFLPGGRWRVHDGNRPQPAVVTPGAGGGLGASPPSDAIVLFDGKDLARWRSRDGGEARWKVGEGWFEVVAGTGDLFTKEEFGDCQLHLEWSAPPPSKGSGQGRGNSGLFFMDRYEVQILDSFENATYADGQAAAIYGQHPPLVNACRPPGEWQSYDAIFRAPRFRDGELESPATLTVFHNGVLVHDRATVFGATAHRALPAYAPHGPAGPLRLQDHGDPVRFRNAWIRRLP